MQVPLGQLNKWLGNYFKMCLSFEKANAPFVFVATLASCLGQQVLYILNYFSHCDSSCYYFTYT